MDRSRVDNFDSDRDEGCPDRPGEDNFGTDYKEAIGLIVVGLFRGYQTLTLVHKFVVALDLLVGFCFDCALEKRFEIW